MQERLFFTAAAAKEPRLYGLAGMRAAQAEIGPFGRTAAESIAPEDSFAHSSLGFPQQPQRAPAELPCSPSKAAAFGAGRFWPGSFWERVRKTRQARRAFCMHQALKDQPKPVFSCVNTPFPAAFFISLLCPQTHGLYGAREQKAAPRFRSPTACRRACAPHIGLPCCTAPQRPREYRGAGACAAGQRLFAAALVYRNAQPVSSLLAAQTPRLPPKGTSLHMPRKAQLPPGAGPLYPARNCTQCTVPTASQLTRRLSPANSSGRPSTRPRRPARPISSARHCRRSIPPCKGRPALCVSASRPLFVRTSARPLLRREAAPSSAPAQRARPLRN